MQRKNIYILEKEENCIQSFLIVSVLHGNRPLAFPYSTNSTSFLPVFITVNQLQNPLPLYVALCNESFTELAPCR